MESSFAGDGSFVILKQSGDEKAKKRIKRGKRKNIYDDFVLRKNFPRKNKIIKGAMIKTVSVQKKEGGVGTVVFAPPAFNCSWSLSCTCYYLCCYFKSFLFH